MLLQEERDLDCMYSNRSFDFFRISKCSSFWLTTYFLCLVDVFSTDSQHTYGHQLCSSSRRLVPLFVWGRLHTRASQEKVFYKIRCLFLAQGICIYVGHSFLMKHSWTNSLNVSFSLEWGIVVSVLLFSPTCSFIRMRQTSYKGFSRKTKRS
jgi:hypothetical protein